MKCIYSTVPDAVHNLRCKRDSPSSLTTSWEEPRSSEMSSAVNYKVSALKVQHMNSGSRELESVPLVPAFSKVVNETNIQVTQRLGMYNTVMPFVSVEGE